MTFAAQQDTEYGGAPLLLFRFFSGERSWQYTNQRASILRGSDEYAPQVITMGGTEQSAQEPPRGVEINLPSNDPLALEFKPFLPPQPIEVDVFTRHRTDPDGQYRTVFIGECGSCNFNMDGTATITCYPLGHKLQRVIPWPVYSATCNWAVYSHGCGVDRELFKVQGTVGAISADTISVAAAGAKPDDWFAAGYVVRDATGELRWIVAHAGGVLTLVAPFLGLQSGEALTMFPGCDGLELTCKDKFNNLPRHVGFPDVPRKNPFTENVFGTGTGAGGKSDAERVVDGIMGRS